jgi:hypothetical protein
MAAVATLLFSTTTLEPHRSIPFTTTDRDSTLLFHRLLHSTTTNNMSTEAQESKDVDMADAGAEAGDAVDATSEVSKQIYRRVESCCLLLLLLLLLLLFKGSLGSL